MFNFSLFLVFAALLLWRGSGTSLEYDDFILGETEEFSRTSSGEIRVLMGSQEAQPLKEHEVAVSRVILEPRALLLPHYMDAALVFYVERGEAVIGLVHSKGAVKKELKCGDVYSIPAGTVHYVLNTNNSEQLELVGVFDTSASLRSGKLESFFVAGGVNPRTALSGFRSSVLAAAFKVSKDELSIFLDSQDRGPIIPTTVQAFDGLNYLESVVSNKKTREEKKHKDDKKHKEKKHDEDEEGKKHKKGDDEKKHKKDEGEKKHKKDEDEKKHHKEKLYNLFERRLFENEHGWISSTMGESVEALASARFDVSVVKLRSGSLLAPHWNPRGARFGLVTKGTGNIQIAFSNGTNAVDAKVEAGTVFHVPQFLPVCQIASGSEEFEFVTFTASPLFGASTSERLQFLAGEGSVLQKMDVGVLALAFNLPDHLVSGFLSSQQEEMIFSSVTMF